MSDNRDLEVFFNCDNQPQDIFDDDDLTADDVARRHEKIAQTIGYVVIHFNALEDLVSLVICDLTFERLSYQDERSVVFLSEMTFSQKVSTLAKLYGLRIRFDDFQRYEDRLREIVNRLTESARRRNQYAHADWLGSESMKWVRVKTKVSRQRDRVFHLFRAFDDLDMADDLTYIKETAAELDDFHEKVYQEMVRRM